MQAKDKKPDPELEQDEDDVEVEDSGPAIASGKKSKLAVVAASVTLAIVVFYFFFFSDSEKKEDLQKVEVPQVAKVAPSETGKSPFELEAQKEEKMKSDIDILAQPITPEVPTLPELPKDAVAPDKILFAPQDQQLLPTQGNQNQDQQPQQQTVQQAAQIENAEQQKTIKQTNPRYSPIVVFGGASGGQGGGQSSTPGVGYDNNIVALNKDGIDSLQQTKSKVVATYIADRVHTIAQGKLLTAVLETAINTELPGSVRAVVSRDVYGESGNEILIPKGSRLFGSYSSQISRGQGRVQIGWTRLIRPDGVDMAITFQASDQFGRTGLSGEVDNKYSSIIANSMLTSILAIGGVAAVQRFLINNDATTTTVNPTQGTTTTTGSATNQALYDVTKTIIDTVGQLISSTINLTPTIRVPQGTKITVIVNADITVPASKK
ncbi:MAG: TrbI/VirB10 family protein [Alphaproteobacteria bacterium]|nr:TrbI/VirB10 family protein [Alphaproteobacteria bacterium]